MSLSAETQTKIRVSEKVRNIIANTFNFLRPDVYFIVFLITSLVLAFFNSWGFYIVFGIFVICFFAERIILKINKKKDEKVV